MKPCITTVTETGEVMPTVLPKQGFVGSSVKKKKIKKEAVIGLIFILIPLVGYVIFSGSTVIFVHGAVLRYEGLRYFFITVE